MNVNAHTKDLSREATKNTHKNTHTKRRRSTPRSTQVRGPRVEVKPLLLPLSLCIIESGQALEVLGRVTEVLLELYSGLRH